MRLCVCSSNQWCPAKLYLKDLPNQILLWSALRLAGDLKLVISKQEKMQNDLELIESCISRNLSRTE